jgi:hypothetical protein
MTAKRIHLLFLALFGLFIGGVIDYFNFLNLQFEIGEPVTNFSILLLATSFLSFFIRDKIFQSWIRFGYWWLPLSILVIAIAPTTGHDWALGGPTREIMSWVMGGLFFIISTFIMAVKSLKLRGK